MPRPAADRDELDAFAAAPDEEVSGDFQPPDLFEIGMAGRIEAVGEQALDRVAAISAGRQANLL